MKWVKRTYDLLIGYIGFWVIWAIIGAALEMLISIANWVITGDIHFGYITETLPDWMIRIMIRGLALLTAILSIGYAEDQEKATDQEEKRDTK